MNKTEATYGFRLELRKKAGEIVDYKFESIRLRLAKNTFYTPDYFVVLEDCIEIHEVKGFWEEDARVKIKVAAELYPCFRFIAVRGKAGAWEFESIEPTRKEVG